MENLTWEHWDLPCFLPHKRPLLYCSGCICTGATVRAALQEFFYVTCYQTHTQCAWWRIHKFPPLAERYQSVWKQVTALCMQKVVVQGTSTENGRHASLGLLHNNTELKGITFPQLQITIAKYLENLRRRIFSGHKLPALPSNIIWVGLSMNKQVNKCKKVSSETKKNLKPIQQKERKKTHPRYPQMPLPKTACRTALVPDFIRNTSSSWSWCLLESSCCHDCVARGQQQI